jgi:hypothetical protein
VSQSFGLSKVGKPESMAALRSRKTTAFQIRLRISTSWTGIVLWRQGPFTPTVHYLVTARATRSLHILVTVKVRLPSVEDN